MAKEGLSEQDAFARLRKASQVSGRPLKVVAEAVVATLEPRERASERGRAARDSSASSGRPTGTARPLRGRRRLACPGLDTLCRGVPRPRCDRPVSAPHAELTDGTYHVELLWAVADDDHLVAVYRAVGERPDGRELDIEQALLVELEDARWNVMRAQPLDQAAFDAFWNASCGRAPAWLGSAAGCRSSRVRRFRSCPGGPPHARRGASGSEARRGDRRNRVGCRARLRRRHRGGRPSPRRDAANLVRFGPTPHEGSSSASGASRASRSPAPARSSLIERRPARPVAQPARRLGCHGRPRRPRRAPPAAARARRHIPRRRPDRRSRRDLGRLAVSLTRDLRFAANAEERLGQFAACRRRIANAQAREELATLADEQAALSRVAVAVATEERSSGSSPRARGDRPPVRRPTPLRPCATRRRHEAEIVGRWHRGSTTSISTSVFAPSASRRDLARRARLAYSAIDLERSRPTFDACSACRRRAPSRRTDRRLRTALGRHLDLDGAASPSFHPASRRGSRSSRASSLSRSPTPSARAADRSRARIVQAGDAERRGSSEPPRRAQQRFISLSLRLRIAPSQLSDDPAPRRSCSRRRATSCARLEELRELARGIHPAVLTDHGLTPAVDALATRATLPRRAQRPATGAAPRADRGSRLLRCLGVARNIAKYASASRAHIDLDRDDGVLVVEVSDHGVGGANAAAGTGSAMALRDRVEALGGRLRVSSELGLGTTVRPSCRSKWA